MKGVAQVIDALAGIAILAIFVLGSFSVVDGQRWSDYQNSISAEDMGYTLERSGLIEGYINSSDFGDIKSVVETASRGTLEPSLEELNMPKSVKIGIHVHQNEIERIDFSQVDYPDECMSNPTDSVIPGYNETNKPPIVSTENNSGNLMDITGVEVYLGQIDRQETRFGSELNYNALWVENESQCSFNGPYFPGENFFWGNKSNSKPGGVYQFYRSNTTSKGSSWEGILEVHEAEYVENIIDEIESQVAGFETQTDLNTFRISDEISVYDVLIFRGKSRSIDLIEGSSDVRSDLSSYLKRGGNILLQANLDQDAMDKYSKTLEDLFGFRWFDHEYEANSDSRCELNVDNVGLKSKCSYNVSFQKNKEGLKSGSVFKYDLSGNKTNISFPVNNSVYSKDSAPLTSKKGMVMENYYYKGYNSGIEADLDTAGSDYPGKQLNSEECDVYSGDVELFPTESDYDREFSIIEITDSSGNCDNSFVVGVENKESNLYSQGDRVTINGVEFRINITSSNTIMLKTQRIPNINLVSFNYMNRSYPKVGLTGYWNYPSNYTEDDYKVLASTLYYLSLPHSFERRQDPDKITETIGNIGSEYRPYRIRVGWNW